MLAAVLTLAVTGCGETQSDSDASVTRAATGSVAQPELSVSVARKQGLLRSDAVRVSAPTDVQVVQRRTRVPFRIDVPAAAKANRVQVELSGTCAAALETGGTRAVLRAQAGVARAWAVVKTAPGKGAACDLTLDAYVPERVDTGGGFTVRVDR